MYSPVREFISISLLGAVLQDLTFFLCKIQGFTVAKSSFPIWREEGDGFWHRAEKLCYKSWYQCVKQE